MQTLRIYKDQTQTLNDSVRLTGSKSESNRLLILQALFDQFSIDNLSNADDVQVMKKGLQTKSGTVDIHHAGTAMRFLTAYFATQEGSKVELTGSSRMKERPIEILVNALRHLGAKIEYLEKEGFPPLDIQGTQLSQYKVSLPADISSQYISALMLIAPSLPKGLEIELVGKVTSVPYIQMTQGLLQSLGAEISFSNNRIRVKPLDVEVLTLEQIAVESDWSAASYYYSIVALSPLGSSIELSVLKESSLQGDRVLATIYESFGVHTVFLKDKVRLEKINTVDASVPLTLDLANAPDIAQTIAVTALGLGMCCDLYGLHTLPIKETDRLNAMKIELEKCGAKVRITTDSLHLEQAVISCREAEIDTYQDHRMAMAFAPLALRIPLQINQADVVSKSYPDFWKDLKRIGFEIST